MFSSIGSSEESLIRRVATIALCLLVLVKLIMYNVPQLISGLKSGFHYVRLLNIFDMASVSLVKCIVDTLAGALVCGKDISNSE